MWREGGGIGRILTFVWNAVAKRIMLGYQGLQRKTVVKDVGSLNRQGLCGAYIKDGSCCVETTKIDLLG